MIYMQAFLTSRFVWQKRVPEYEKVFKKSKKDMSDDEMFAVVKKLNAKFEGSDN